MKKLVSTVFIVLNLVLNIAHATSSKAFFQSHGFVFFFASTCHYCHQFSPILGKVANDFNARVLPLSFDNQPLPEFKEFWPATPDWTTIAFKNQSIQYPALFIANLNTQILYPVSIGALDESALMTRLEELIPKIMMFENTGNAS